MRKTDQKQPQRKLKIQGVLQKDGYLEPVTFEEDLHEKEIQDSDERFNDLGLIKRLKSPIRGPKNKLTPDLRDKLLLKSYQIVKKPKDERQSDEQVNSICDIIGQGLQVQLDDVSVDYEIVVILNTPLPIIACLYEQWEGLNTNDLNEFQDVFKTRLNVKWVIPYFHELMDSMQTHNIIRFRNQIKLYQQEGSSLECCYCDTSEQYEYDENKNYAIYGIGQVDPCDFDYHAKTFFTILDSFPCQSSTNNSWYPFYQAIEYCIPFIVFNPTIKQNPQNFVTEVKKLFDNNKTLTNAREKLLKMQSTSKTFQQGLRTGVIDLFESSTSEFKTTIDLFDKSTQHSKDTTTHPSTERKQS